MTEKFDAISVEEKLDVGKHPESSAKINGHIHPGTELAKSTVKGKKESSGDSSKTRFLTEKHLIITNDSVSAFKNSYMENAGLQNTSPSPLVLQKTGGNIWINDNNCYLRNATDEYHGLGWYGIAGRDNRIFGNMDIDGPVLFGFAGGALGINDGMRKVTLWWQGNTVNIGNKDFFGNLVVQGKEGIHRFRANADDGTVTLRDLNNNATILMQCDTGDILVSGADCAEEFSVSEPAKASPGTVMVINSEGSLEPGTTGYDRRVAGVISGAGDLRPGITLGRQNGLHGRLPLALSGKVFCKVDAEYSPVRVGDLLTTSPTTGHAMKAVDRKRSFGAVIGKALNSLTEGSGLIPILVSLQ